MTDEQASTRKDTKEPTTSKPEPFFPLYLPNSEFILFSLAVSLLAILLSRWSLLTHFDTHYLGGFSGDGGLYVWLSERVSRSVSPGWFETLSFYPYGKTLAWSDNYLLPAVFSWFLQALGFHQVTAYNTTLLSAQLLVGILSAILCYQLSGKRELSLLSGFLAALFPPLLSQTGHPQLAWFFVIPLSLIILFTFLSKRTPIIYGFGYGLCILIAFLSSVYYAAFLAVLLPTFFLGVWLLRPNNISLKAIFLFCLEVVVTLLPFLPYALPYLSIRSVFGGKHIYEAHAFSAHGLSYLASSPFSWLYSSFQGFGREEGYLFAGIVPLVVLIAAYRRITSASALRTLNRSFLVAFLVTFIFSHRNLLRWLGIESTWGVTLLQLIATLGAWASLVIFALLIRRLGKLESKLGFEVFTQRATVSLLLFISLMCFVLSLGPLGSPESGQFSFSPWRVVYNLVPGMDGVRAISRIGIIAVFCVCLLIPLIVPLLNKKIGSFPAATLCSLLGIVVLLESCQSKYPIEPAPKTPLAYHQLALRESAPLDGAYISLPYATSLTNTLLIDKWSSFAALQVSYMNWGLSNSIFSIDGYSGQRTQYMRELPGALLRFPDQRSIETLGTIAGVNYIVYHGDLIENFDSKKFLQQVNMFSHNLSVIFEPTHDQAYLLSFQPGQTKLSEGFQLRVPPYPNGELSLTLMSLYEPENPVRIVQVREIDQLENQVITSIGVAADGDWHKVVIPLPEAEEPARPFRLVFELPQEGQYFLGERDFRISQ